DAWGLGMGRRLPSRSGVATSTRHWRQAPTGLSSGWSQNRGIAMPICSAARITSVPFGTATSTSSMVKVTVSAWATSADAFGVVVVMLGPFLPTPLQRRAAPGAGCVLEQRGCRRVEGAALPGDVRLELLAEELDAGRDGRRRAVAERAERAAQDVVADVHERVEVLERALAVLDAVQHELHPVGALAARRALAAGLVRVELRPPRDRAHHARRLVEDLQRARAEHRPGLADRLVVERHVEVLLGEQRGRGAAGRPE